MRSSKPLILRFQQHLRRIYLETLRPKIPVSLKRLLAAVYSFWVTARLTPAVTRLLGPRYRRNTRRLDIDITWDCNLKCVDCNRSCTQAPTREQMTLGQIQQFIDESIERQIPWYLIHVAGGEPTAHPQFLEIVQMLCEYRDKHAPRTEIRVTSNGFGERTKRVLAGLPAGVNLLNTAKTSRVQEGFLHFNVAPRDLAQYRNAEFSNACSIARDCGLGLTPNGYYPCPIAGGMDRVLGFDLARHRIPDEQDPMCDELRAFCSWCGFFRMNSTADIAEGSPTVTPSWEAAYESWRRQSPSLRPFRVSGECLSPRK